MILKVSVDTKILNALSLTHTTQVLVYLYSIAIIAMPIMLFFFCFPVVSKIDILQVMVSII